jgi:hypothetical protein
MACPLNIYLMEGAQYKALYENPAETGDHEGVFMSMSQGSNIGNQGLSRPSITTLYDLMEEINAVHQLEGAAAGSGTPPTIDYDHPSEIAQAISRMFETGQIRFMNVQNVKRHYADLLV